MGVGIREGEKEGYSIQKGEITIIPFLFSNQQKQNDS